ncbi:uncharacterized protein LOC128644617 [Bombina bombina]|uniref:uncharacterized protein LOC128644617 n=1 Tax=Bombina bombina TaxID=8345 RepID=UPI00235A8CB1|nr:uncharacterized protein LOC128644617 [Bombina bombina]
MGAKFAPSYANLYMGWWEAAHVYGDSNPHKEHIIFYGRYIDDLLVVWDGDVELARDFVSNININNMNLKFTSHVSLDHIEFLDVDITVDTVQQTVNTSVYRKPTGGNTILNYKSSHPQHVKKGIPKGQYIRTKRLCSDRQTFEKQCQILEDRLLQRNYPLPLLKKTKEDVEKIPRENLLIYKRKTNKQSFNKQNKQRESKIVFSTPYSLEYHKICDIIKQSLPILATDTSLEHIAVEGCRYVARKSKTIGNIIAPSDLASVNTRTWLPQRFGFFKCRAQKCKTCSHVVEGMNFTSTTTNRTYNIRYNLNCKSNHVIYLLTCRGCNIQYVGKTKRLVRDRAQEHIRDIEDPDIFTPVARHFKSEHSGNAALMFIQAIDHVPPHKRGGDRIQRLDYKEAQWIFLLNTRHPHGINKESDVNFFI